MHGVDHYILLEVNAFQRVFTCKIWLRYNREPALKSSKVRVIGNSNLIFKILKFFICSPEHLEQLRKANAATLPDEIVRSRRNDEDVADLRSGFEERRDFQTQGLHFRVAVKIISLPFLLHSPLHALDPRAWEEPMLGRRLNYLTIQR